VGNPSCVLGYKEKAQKGYRLLLFDYPERGAVIKDVDFFDSLKGQFKNQILFPLLLIS
jgi:hypothetical protein